MNLLKSARGFLIESLDNYHSRDKMSFSIVHAITAVELLLKERLERFHESLIYKDIDLVNVRKQNTIGLLSIPQRLKNLGVQLKEEDCCLIKNVSAWRNAIVHHLPTHDNHAAKVKFELLYNFIINFLVNELGEDFHDFLPKKYYQSMENIIDELNKKIIFAKHKANKSGCLDEKNPCAECNIVGVVEIRNEDGAFCHFCMKELHTAICAGCEKQLHIYSKGIPSEECCTDCVEAAGQEYIQHLIDLERGK